MNILSIGSMELVYYFIIPGAAILCIVSFIYYFWKSYSKKNVQNTSTSSYTNDELIKELKKLKDLHVNEAITDDEFLSLIHI